MVELASLNYQACQIQGAVFILDRHPEAITWNYIVRSDRHEVIVLDTRTWRGYPADQKPIAPPMLLCPKAFKQQLVLPLEEVAEQTQIQTTFVIAPTNVFGLQVIDWIHHWNLQQEKVFSTDVGDAWNVNVEALAEFLTTLFEKRQQVVILSGDIHYSSVAHLSYTRTHSKLQSVLVQLTALVHFELADGNSSCKVIQDLYWFSSWYPVQVVSSRFESQLTPNQSLLLEFTH